MSVINGESARLANWVLNTQNPFQFCDLYGKKPIQNNPSKPLWKIEKQSSAFRFPFSEFLNKLQAGLTRQKDDKDLYIQSILDQISLQPEEVLDDLIKALSVYKEVFQKLYFMNVILRGDEISLSFFKEKFETFNQPSQPLHASPHSNEAAWIKIEEWVRSILASNAITLPIQDETKKRTICFELYEIILQSISNRNKKSKISLLDQNGFKTYCHFFEAKIPPPNYTSIDYIKDFDSRLLIVARMFTKFYCQIQKNVLIHPFTMTPPLNTKETLAAKTKLYQSGLDLSKFMQVIQDIREITPLSFANLDQSIPAFCTQQYHFLETRVKAIDFYKQMIENQDLAHLKNALFDRLQSITRANGPNDLEACSLSIVLEKSDDVLRQYLVFLIQVLEEALESKKQQYKELVDTLKPYEKIINTFIKTMQQAKDTLSERMLSALVLALFNDLYKAQDPSPSSPEGDTQPFKAFLLKQLFVYWAAECQTPFIKECAADFINAFKTKSPDNPITRRLSMLNHKLNQRVKELFKMTQLHGSTPIERPTRAFIKTSLLIQLNEIPLFKKALLLYQDNRVTQLQPLSMDPLVLVEQRRLMRELALIRKFALPSHRIFIENEETLWKRFFPKNNAPPLNSH